MASTTLLRSASKMGPELGAVLTYAGKIDPGISSVKVAAPITVVFLTDSLSPAEIETVKKEVLAFYALLHGRPFRLAILGNGSIGVAGPFTSQAQIKSTLGEVAARTDRPVAAVSAPTRQLLDNLCASAGRLGADWSRVFLIGALPPLEAPVREYASALLLRAFINAHLQVSWYAFSGATTAGFPFSRRQAARSSAGRSVTFFTLLMTCRSLIFSSAVPSSGFECEQQDLRRRSPSGQLPVCGFEIA